MRRKSLEAIDLFQATHRVADELADWVISASVARMNAWSAQLAFSRGKAHRDQVDFLKEHVPAFIEASGLHGRSGKANIVRGLEQATKVADRSRSADYGIAANEVLFEASERINSEFRQRALRQWSRAARRFIRW